MAKLNDIYPIAIENTKQKVIKESRFPNCDTCYHSNYRNKHRSPNRWK
jgi:hypothetical protein